MWRSLSTLCRHDHLSNLKTLKIFLSVTLRMMVICHGFIAMNLTTLGIMVSSQTIFPRKQIILSYILV